MGFNFCILCASKVIVIPTSIFTIWRERGPNIELANTPKLLSLFHGILVYTNISWYILRIPEGRYIVCLLSDAVTETYRNHPVSSCWSSWHHLTCLILLYKTCAHNRHSTSYSHTRVPCYEKCTYIQYVCHLHVITSNSVNISYFSSSKGHVLHNKPAPMQLTWSLVWYFMLQSIYELLWRGWNRDLLS